MAHRALSMVVAVLCVTSVVTGLVTAAPPRPGTEDNGLSENESATLWSRDADDYITQDEYRQRFGTNRSAVHQVANGTDITFTRPPATAATWTRNDFEDLNASGPDTSVHPPHAELESGVYIEDAHATIFAAQPSTRGHLEPGKTPLYVASNGTIRGLVDYRVRLPNTAGNTTTEWSLVEHDITAVRVQQDGKTIAETNGSHTPAIDYQIDDDGRVTLTLEADIRVRLKGPQTSDGNASTSVGYHEATRTVSDSIAVEVYDLAAYSYYAEYPDGDTGVAVFQSEPWQGYTLTESNNKSVRGVWRFYTARNTSWDTLIRSNRTETASVASDAIPVYVHAYPSEIGPRAEPVRGGPEITDTWGEERTTPRPTIGENVTIGVVNQSYMTTAGVAVRAETVDRDALQVAGIVRGVNASVTDLGGRSARQLRQSSLTVETLRQNQSQTTLRIELQDTQTNAPIALNDSERQSLLGTTLHGGYITIGDRRIETNASGVALVTIDEPGIYTARYHPGSWLGYNPAYVSDTATVRWHPLTTLEGWFALFVEVGWQLLPFFVMLYAGKRILRMLGPEEIFQRNHD